MDGLQWKILLKMDDLGVPLLLAPFFIGSLENSQPESTKKHQPEIPAVSRFDSIQVNQPLRKEWVEHGKENLLQNSRKYTWLIKVPGS